MSSAITCHLKGNFKKTNSFLEKCMNFIRLGRLDHYGRVGVEELKKVTPVNTGLLASSWKYKIQREEGVASIIFSNGDVEGGQNVAILVLYGHGTRHGVWVPGVDFLTPAMSNVIDIVAKDMRKEIQSL